MIQVGKRIGLDFFKFRFTDGGSVSHGSPGRVTGVQKTGEQGENRQDSHPDSNPQDIMDIPGRNAGINNICHKKGNDQFKAGFRDDERMAARNSFLKGFKKEKTRLRSFNGKTPFIIE